MYSPVKIRVAVQLRSFEPRFPPQNATRRSCLESAFFLFVDKESFVDKPEGGHRSPESDMDEMPVARILDCR